MPKPAAGWNTLLEPLLWLLFAGGAFLLSLSFDGPLPTYELGAAFWPKVVCAIIALAATVLLIDRFVHGKADMASETTQQQVASETEVAGASWQRIALLFALPMAWVLAMHKIGFLLATPPFLLAFTWSVGVTRWRPLLIFSLGFYAAIVLVFYKLIFTPLPMGAGWFNALNGKFLGLIQ